MSKILVVLPDNICYRNYDMPYFVLDAIAIGKHIPDNATNGDMIKAMFPNVIISESEDTVHLKYPTVNSDPLFFVQVSKRWWNAPYKAESENT